MRIRNYIALIIMVILITATISAQSYKTYTHEYFDQQNNTQVYNYDFKSNLYHIFHAEYDGYYSSLYEKDSLNNALKNLFSLYVPNNVTFTFYPFIQDYVKIDGNYYVLLNLERSLNNQCLSYYNSYVVKFDSTFNKVWEIKLAGNSIYMHKIFVHNNNSLLLIGENYSQISTRLVFSKISLNGEVLINKQISINNQIAYMACADLYDNIIYLVSQTITGNSVLITAINVNNGTIIENSSIYNENSIEKTYLSANQILVDDKYIILSLLSYQYNTVPYLTIKNTKPVISIISRNSFKLLQSKLIVPENEIFNNYVECRLNKVDNKYLVSLNYSAKINSNLVHNVFDNFYLYNNLNLSKDLHRIKLNYYSRIGNFQVENKSKIKFYTFSGNRILDFYELPDNFKSDCIEISSRNLRSKNVELQYLNQIAYNSSNLNFTTSSEIEYTHKTNYYFIEGINCTYNQILEAHNGFESLEETNNEQIENQDSLIVYSSVYPNPFKEKIFIKLPESNYQFELNDLNHNTVLKGNLEQNYLNLEALSSGVYIVKFKDLNNQKIFKYKLIKQ